MNRILFSPIGDTDPVRDDYDGAMLHIVRHWKPDVVYLYFSDRMLEHHKRDNRYVEFIKRVHPKCIIEIIESDVENPHQFDSYTNVFSKYISEIEEKYSDSDILVNLSSGTPQMKAALALEVSTHKTPLIPIQVSSPKKSSNAGTGHLGENIDIDLLFSNLYDNLQEAENRCFTPKMENFYKANAKVQINSFINLYNYKAALFAIKNADKFFVKEVYDLIEHMEKRVDLKLIKKKETFTIQGLEIYPVSNIKANEVIDYYYAMMTKVSADDINSLVLMVSPISARLAYLILTDVIKFDLASISEYEREIIVLKREKLLAREPKLLENIEAEFRSMFRDSSISLNLCNIIINYCLNERKDLFKDESEYDFFKINVINRLEKLRNIEKSIRNISAHNIFVATSDLLRKEVNISPEDIMSDLKYLIKFVFRNEKKIEDAFSLLDRVNLYIGKMLDK